MNGFESIIFLLTKFYKSLSIKDLIEVNLFSFDCELNGAMRYKLSVGIIDSESIGKFYVLFDTDTNFGYNLDPSNRLSELWNDLRRKII